MDHVDFVAPIDIGEVVVVQAYVFDAGTTSVDVRVDVHAEKPHAGESEQRHAGTGHRLPGPTRSIPS